MLKTFQNHINQNLTFLKESKILIAISGGIDSVVLTHLCCDLKLNIALAHCNFNLRAEESDADETFVLQLAEALDLEIFIENFDTQNYAKTNKRSTQMAARELRYNWFYELAKQLHFDYILTAHHADDNLETFLINLSRGTGLDGLTGIPEINDIVVRPLLRFSRQNIEDYTAQNHLKWREDRSNASTKYLRNKLRHEVIPKLKEINPLLLQNFETTQNHLQDAKLIITDVIEDIENQVIDRITPEGVFYNIEKLQNLNHPKAYVYQLLNDFNFTEWNDVYHLLSAQSGKQLFSATHRLLKDRNHLILSEIRIKSDQVFHISENENDINIPLGILNIENIDVVSDNIQNEIYVDKTKLKFPLIVRPWQKGDYFYPFGMQGKKKLSKYFKDEKLSLLQKENTWVLCSQNDVIWIINKRADNRYKVTSQSSQILKITLQ